MDKVMSGEIQPIAPALVPRMGGIVRRAAVRRAGGRAAGRRGGRGKCCSL